MYLRLSAFEEEKIKARFSFDGTPDFENELSDQDISKYLTAVFRPSSASIGLLPPAVRWLSPDRKIVVFERPPVMQNIEIIQAKRDKIGENSNSFNKIVYTIPLPWTVYMAFFNADYEPVKLKVYVRNEPLTSMDDPIFMIPLHNFYYDSSLCNPIWNEFYDGINTLAMGVERAFNMVWNSGFNYDLVDALSLAQHSGVFQQFWQDPRSVIPKNLHPKMVGDNFLDFYLYWSQLPISDVLSTKWNSPSTSTRHNNPTEMNLSFALNHFVGELEAEFGDPKSDFVLRLMNAMYG